MPDIWTAEVTYEVFSHVAPAPSATQINEQVQIRFGAEDTDSFAVQGGLAIRMRRERHSFGAGPTYEYRTVVEHVVGAEPNNSTVPIGTGGAISTLTEANGQNGAAFMAGGTLRITKDENAQTVTFESPLGVQVHTFAEALTSAGQMRADGILHQWRRPDSDQDGETLIHWYGMWTTKNGTRVHGAALSSTQPGQWQTVAEPDSPWIVRLPEGLAAVNPISRLNLQFPNRLQSGFSYIDAADAPRDLSTQEWRLQPEGLLAIDDIALYLDLCRDPDTGLLWYARVVKQEPEKVKVGYSDDGGLTWTEVNGCDCPGTHNRTPNMVFVGRILILWWDDGDEDGMQINHAESDTLGRVWSEPTAVPILAVIDSFHVAVDPVTGRLINVYRVAAGLSGVENLQIEAAMAPGDLLFNEPPDPPAVLTTIPEPVYTELRPYTTGVFHLNYCHGGNKRQFRSDSHGVIWEEHFNFASPECHPTHREYNGLTYHLYWKADSTLQAYPSATVGEIAFHLLGTTVATAVAEQRADIEIGPTGGLVVAWQEYDAINDRWNVVTKRSDTYAQSWS